MTGVIAFLFTTIERTDAVNEEPLEHRITDVPLTAACREIERDLPGDPGGTELPPRLESHGGYLY